MKARIAKPDGTVVELDGTPAEIAEACGWRSAPTYIPTIFPVPYPYAPYPWWSSEPIYVEHPATTITWAPTSTSITVSS